MRLSGDFLQNHRLAPHVARRFSFGGELNWMTILFAVGAATIIPGPQSESSQSKKTEEVSTS